jgi:uncharacterized protein YkwD
MSAICALLPLLAACAAPAPASPQTGFYASLAQPQARIDAVAAREVINGYRRNLGLPLVVIDQAMMRVAEQEATRIRGAGDLAAVNWLDAKARLNAAGVSVQAARASVSAGYYTFSDAFSGWRGSPPHDATLRFQPARRFGIATSYQAGSRYGVYWVLLMAD